MVVVAETQARTPEPFGKAAPALLSLDLGSGPYPAAGYVGVDLDIDGVTIDSAPEGFVFCNLLDGRPWPFDDGSVARLRAWHFIEHIPCARVKTGRSRVRRTIKSPGLPARHVESFIDITQDLFFWFFEETYRIAAPGCRFELAWPHPDSDGADQDPTHYRRVRGQTMHYLGREGRARMRVSHYPCSANWAVEAVHELAPEGALDPFTRPDGSVDIDAARRARGVFSEMRAVLIKPEAP